MKGAFLFAISLGLNVALAATALWVWRQPAPAPVASAGGSVAVALPASGGGSATNAASVAFVTNRFDWRTLLSTNFADYAANLRALGCPERTVRDIIFDAADREYAARSRLLRGRVPFWLPGPQRQTIERERERAEKALNQEIQFAVMQAVSCEWNGDVSHRHDFTDVALMRFVIGSVNEEKFERVTRLMSVEEAAENEVRARSNGILIEEDYAAVRAARDELQRQLAATLTPAELTEFTARLVAIQDLFGATRSAGFEYRAGELRQLCLITSEVNGWPGDRVDLSDDDTAEQHAARELLLRERTQQLMGAARYAEFVLGQDENFRSIFSVTENHELPKAAQKIYEIRRLTAEESQRVRADAALDETARRAQMERMSGAVQKQISHLLGEEALREYLNSGGGWMTNMHQL